MSLTVTINSVPITITLSGVGPQGPSGGGGGGGGVTVTPISTSPFMAGALSGINIYTIYNNEFPFVFDLPVDPASNQEIQILDAGLNSAAYPININGNGNNICAYGAKTTSISIASNGGSISLVWDGTQWTQNG